MKPTIFGNIKKAVAYSVYILIVYILVLTAIELSNNRLTINNYFPENFSSLNTFLANFFHIMMYLGVLLLILHLLSSALLAFLSSKFSIGKIFFVSICFGISLAIIFFLVVFLLPKTHDPDEETMMREIARLIFYPSFYLTPIWILLTGRFIYRNYKN